METVNPVIVYYDILLMLSLLETRDTERIRLNFERGKATLS